MPKRLRMKESRFSLAARIITSALEKLDIGRGSWRAADHAWVIEVKTPNGWCPMTYSIAQKRRVCIDAIVPFRKAFPVYKFRVKKYKRA